MMDHIDATKARQFRVKSQLKPADSEDTFGLLSTGQVGHTRTERDDERMSSNIRRGWDVQAHGPSRNMCSPQHPEGTKKSPLPAVHKLKLIQQLKRTLEISIPIVLIIPARGI